MIRIRKISALLFTALFAAVILMPMVKPAQADIESWMWLPPYHTYGTYVNGTTAKMKIAVKCPTNVWPDVWDNILVTAVSIVFYQWGDINKSLSTSTTIENENWYFFEPSFTATVEEFTELMSHYFYIQVNFKINGTKPDRWQDYGYGFKVISQDQKDAMDLRDKYESYYNAYYPSTVKARLLVAQARAEKTIADSLFATNDFTGAKGHYQTAVDLYEQAFSVDEEKGIAIENATIIEADAAAKTADAAMLQAQAIMNQSYGYILFGLGFILIGIGAILYGVKKPKTS